MAGQSGIDAEAWLEACRRMVAGQREIFAEVSGINARTDYEGIGEGGDRTLVIDRRCEDVAFAELERLHDEGHEFVAVSEERGEVEFGAGATTRVVIDPIDGSMNARRTIPSYGLSVAVASGTSMADVEFGLVHDFGADEEFTAVRGEGVRLGGEPVVVERPYPGLEVVGVESASPERVGPIADALQGEAYRLRAIGSIAINLAYVAVARFDAMLSGRHCRSVDAAAGQLIVREAGGLAAFGELDLADAPLGLDARYAIAAALDAEGLETVLGVQRRTGSL
ncbi:MAG TPA: inositol monophosphatase family protein [Solirubrobacterales bacterium]